jgi:hypothetical protein
VSAPTDLGWTPDEVMDEAVAMAQAAIQECSDAIQQKMGFSDPAMIEHELIGLFCGVVIEGGAPAIVRWALGQVRALHRPVMAELLAPDCANENCDHEDECPPEERAVCGECSRIADEVDGGSGEMYPAVVWPCPTAVAMGLGVES